MHEILRARHDDDDGLVKVPRRARRNLHALLGILTDAGGAHREPLAAVRADVALRVVFLVDLHDARDGVNLLARPRAQHVLERLAVPIRQDLVTELADIFFADVKAVLRPRRQVLELAIDPAAAALREHDARTHARRAVAHDELARRHADREPPERRRQRMRAHEDARLALMLLIDARDDARLLDRHVARLVEHDLFQPPDPPRHREPVDGLRRERYCFRFFHPARPF